MPDGNQIVFMGRRNAYLPGAHPGYLLRVGRQAAAANTTKFDLFNGTTDKLVRLSSLFPVVGTDAAVTGLVGVRLLFARTTDIGTGGTLALEDAVNASVTSYARLDIRDDTLTALAPLVTVRMTPTGGATAGVVIAETCIFTEETSAGAVTRLELCPAGGLWIAPGTGIRVAQGAVASVGIYSFQGEFEVVPVGL